MWSRRIGSPQNIARAYSFALKGQPFVVNSNATRTLSGSTTSPRFRVLGIQQIAIGALDKQNLSNFWGTLLGIKKVGTFKSEKENVDEDILVVGAGLGEVEIDLMQPIDPNKSPKVHVPALNHIGLWIDNLDAAVQQLTADGIVFTPGGIRKGASGHNVAFIHPKSAVGVLVELVQAPKGVIAAYDTSVTKDN